MKKLPKEIFVIYEYSGDEGGESFLVAHEHPRTLAEVGERIEAGHYILKESVIITADSKVAVKK